MSVKSTALIHSYLRKAYMASALESVLTQACSEPFEVILVTGTTDSNLCEDLESCARRANADFRIVRMGLSSVGQSLARGVEEAAGEVVAFLDDDDLWDARKLATVHRVFDKHPHVGYFHNGQRFIDARSRPVGRFTLTRLVRHPGSSRREGIDVEFQSKDKGAARELLGMEAMFNNSSIAIRKSILDSKLELLRRVEAGEDSFLFFAGLASGMRMWATTDHLTRFRVHPEATASGGMRELNAAGRVSYTNYLGRQLRRIEVCEEMASGQDSPVLADLLLRDKASWMMLTALSQGTHDPETVRNAARVLLGQKGFNPSIRDLLSTMFGTIATVSPGLVRSAFFGWRSIG
jgi:hypothetical protein